ncbi:unnamed protein product [Musa textilis]
MLIMAWSGKNIGVMICLARSSKKNIGWDLKGEVLACLNLKTWLDMLIQPCSWIEPRQYLSSMSTHIEGTLFFFSKESFFLHQLCRSFFFLDSFFSMFFALFDCGVTEILGFLS